MITFLRSPRPRDFVRFFILVWSALLVAHVIVASIQVLVHGRTLAEEVREHLNDFDPIAAVLAVGAWGLLFWSNRDRPSRPPKRSG